MKKLIFILILGSLYAQYLPDVSEMSETEKMLVFENNKKSPTLGILFSLLLPSSGYAYAGKWKKGLIIGGAKTTAILTGFSYNQGTDNNENEIAIGGYLLITGIALHIYEVIDSGIQVNSYNNKLYKYLLNHNN